MKAYIQTERLILRNFKETDAQSMYETYCHSEMVTRYLTWYPHKSVEETRQFLNNVSLPSIEESNSLELAITLKEDEETVIGSISVPNQFENYVAEIGYVIAVKYWNKGYMSEAFSALIDFLFQETPIVKIRALHDINNPASGRVMEKCGLEKMGIMMHQKKFDQPEMDECVFYEMTRGQWQNH